MCRPARTNRVRVDVIRTQVSGETGIGRVLGGDVCSEQPYAFVVLSNHISARCVPPQTTTRTAGAVRASPGRAVLRRAVGPVAGSGAARAAAPRGPRRAG